MARRRTNRTRRGGGYSFGSASVSPGNLVVHPQGSSGGPDCLAAARPGEIRHIPYGGLPGMRGGRYEMSMAPLDAARGVVPTPAHAVRIPCEASRAVMRGGSTFPVLNVGQSADKMVYHAPTAGYSHTMSTGGNVPLLLQAPYAAKSCISTGGGMRRRRRSKRRHTRRHTRRHRRA